MPRLSDRLLDYFWGPEAQPTPTHTAQSLVSRLLARAASLDAATPLRCLQALFCCDAARWHALPDDCPPARRREEQLLTTATTPDDHFSDLLDLSRNLRRALRETPTEAEHLLQALPDGYPVKSTWLHWRDYLLAANQPDRWDPTRRRLLERLHTTGLPASEVTGALLGELDANRWRAESRAIAAVLEPLRAAVGDPGDWSHETRRRWDLSAAGLQLVFLGDELTGARMVHNATDQTSLRGVPQGSRLFQKPAPPAALWLHRAMVRAELLPDVLRNRLRANAARGLSHLARQHRSAHLIAANLAPGILDFGRPDITAWIQAEASGCLAATGEVDEAWSWLQRALRLIGRAPKLPLSGVALRSAMEQVGWVELDQVFDRFSELTDRLLLLARLETSPYLALLAVTREPETASWQRLARIWKLVREEHRLGRPGPVLSCASLLLRWERPEVGMGLLRRLAEPTDDGSPTVLPHNLAAATADLAYEREALLFGLERGQARRRLRADLIRVLLEAGDVATAQAAIGIVLARPPADSKAEQLRDLVALAAGVADGVHWQHRSNLERAIVDEALMVQEWLRQDNPPSSCPRAES